MTIFTPRLSSGATPSSLSTAACLDLEFQTGRARGSIEAAVGAQTTTVAFLPSADLIQKCKHNLVERAPPLLQRQRTSVRDQRDE
jgi:hypothetical protein